MMDVVKVGFCICCGVLWSVTGCSTEVEKSDAPANVPQTAVGKSVSAESSKKVPSSSVHNGQFRNSGEYCQIICRISAELKCRASQKDCEVACDEMHAIPVCREQMQAVMGCITTEPAGHWECSEADIAAIQDGFCQNEQRSFMDCFAQNGK